MPGGTGTDTTLHGAGHRADRSTQETLKAGPGLLGPALSRSAGSVRSVTPLAVPGIACRRLTWDNMGMTIQLRHGMGTGIVEFATPLDPTIWRQYVTGALLEVDQYGMPVPTPGRPLAFQPDYSNDSDEAWRAYAVGTLAMSEKEAAAQDGKTLKRQLHLNPDSSAS